MHEAQNVAMGVVDKERARVWLYRMRRQSCVPHVACVSLQSVVIAHVTAKFHTITRHRYLFAGKK